MALPGDVTKKCPCGNTFKAMRRTAVYCSEKCKKRAQRKESSEETIKALGDDARKAVMGLISYAGGHPDYSWRAQKRLQALVIEILNYCPEKVQVDIYNQLHDSIKGTGYTVRK